MKWVICWCLLMPAAYAASSAESLGPPPAALGVAPFYQKYLDADGIPVLGSAAVPDAALREAAWLLDNVLTGRPSLRKTLGKSGLRVVVMGIRERTTDVPEHAHLQPKRHWDHRARGLGATRASPVVSCGEENLLGYEGDPYPTENIFVHELAHSIADLALSVEDPRFDDRLQRCFGRARQAGLWEGTYAASNHHEYWAEGVQSWFDTNRAADRDHNGVDTRAKLEDYDPELARLLADGLGRTAWRYQPPRQRRERAHLADISWDELPVFSWSDADRPSVAPSSEK